MADAINPAHYKGLFQAKDIQCIALTRQLDFDLGNWAKYIYRLGNKDNPHQDFNKARWYMEDWFAHHTPVDPSLRHAVTVWEEKDKSVMPIRNPFAEKARIAFEFIEPPADNPELQDRYRLLEIVTQDFIIPLHWREMMDAYEDKWLKK
jgi:hypothetical protein